MNKIRPFVKIHEMDPGKKFQDKIVASWKVSNSNSRYSCGERYTDVIIDFVDGTTSPATLVQKG